MMRSAFFAALALALVPAGCTYDYDAAFRCSNGVQDGDEERVDCGGSCQPCPPSCDNGVADGDEQGVDCGGESCAPCPVSCDNGEKDGDEIDVDCGGTACEPCSVGCTSNGDCKSYACIQGVCARPRWLDLGLNKDASVPVPAKRWGGAMAQYGDGSLVLFGGTTGGSTTFGDTWTFNGAWKKASVSGGPSGRRYISMASDLAPGAAGGGRATLLGAPQDGTPKGESWIWDGAAWSKEGSTVPMIFGMSMGHDPASKTTLAFGGLNAGLGWVTTLFARKEGAGWVSKSGASNTPPVRVYAAGAFDPGRGRFVIFGGRTEKSGSKGVAETWEYDPVKNGWEQITGGEAPPARFGAAMAYDEGQEALLMVGGAASLSGGFLNDTWAYDGAWHKIDVYFKKHLFFPMMAYDRPRHRMILFGGATWFSDREVNDTYAYFLLGNPCTSAAECGSGHCETGVCCLTACSTGSCNTPDNPGICAQ